MRITSITQVQIKDDRRMYSLPVRTRRAPIEFPTRVPDPQETPNGIMNKISQRLARATWAA